MDPPLKKVSVPRLFFLLALLAWPAGGGAAARIGEPGPGKIYHGVYPGGSSGDEDDLTAEELKSYEEIVGAKTAWVFFSNNWYKSRAFPLRIATWVRDSGSLPFIRLMLRSDPEQNHAEPLYNLKAILEGRFDADLQTWALDAKAFGTPLLVEWGTEVNGSWFSWNGKWNGGAGEGPQRFVAAFRHIVSVIKAQGADNISWVFHVNAGDDPEESWNRFENYYPGDDVVDWVGLSAYGAQVPTEKWDAEPFRSMVDPAYARIREMAPSKPVAVLEFGCTKGHPSVEPAAWAQAALADLLGNRWPRVIGFSWWNEHWENDDNKAHDTTMRVQDIPELAAVFRRALLQSKDRVQDRPQIR